MRDIEYKKPNSPIKYMDHFFTSKTGKINSDDESLLLVKEAGSAWEFGGRAFGSWYCSVS